MATERKRTGTGGWAFLALVLALYLAAGAFDTELAAAALRLFVDTLATVLPILGLVFLLLLGADLLISPAWIKHHLGAEAGVGGWLVAAAAGVAAAGPVYPWYALLGDLRAKGMRPAFVAVFLYARAVKLPLLPLMVHYFGAAYTIVLTVYLILFALGSGVLVEKLEQRSVPRR